MHALKGTQETTAMLFAYTNATLLLKWSKERSDIDTFWGLATLYGLGRKNLKKTTNFWARKGPKSDEQIYKNLNLMK